MRRPVSHADNSSRSSRLLRGLPTAICGFAILLSSAAGCMQDDMSDLDGLIDDVWLEDFETRNAIEYLQQGGSHYFNDYDDRPESGDVDRDVVLPLLIRLRDECDAETTAVIDEDDGWAWALVVKLPGGWNSRGDIEEKIAQADAEFDGVIDMEWGHKWLSITFEPAEYEE